MILTIIYPALTGWITSASADDSANISAIKEAWGKLEEYQTVFNTVGAIEEIPEGTSKESKKCTVINPVIETEESENQRLGSGYSIYDVKAKEGRTSAVADNDYTVFATSSTSNADLGSFKLSEWDDAYIYIKINSVTKEGKLGFKYGIGWGEQRSDNTIDIKKDMEGSWIKLTADQVCCTKGQGIEDWRSWFKNTGSVLRYWAFQPLDGAEANITFGSLIATRPVSLPSNSSSWTYEEWLNAAANLDFDNYLNTEDLEKLIQANKSLAIKKAWSLLEEYQTVYNTVGAIEEIPEGTSKESKKCTVINPVIETEESENQRLGSGYSIYDVKAKEGRTSAVADNDYTVFATSSTSNADLGSFKLSEWDDAYIYIKINSVTKEGKLGFKYGIGWGEQRSDNTIDIKKDMEGSWIKLTADQVCCTKGQGIEDWRSWFKNTGSVLRYWAFQPLDGAEANITFGSLIATRPVSLPSGSEKWSVDEWVENARALDVSAYLNAEQFKDTLSELGILSDDDLAIDELKAAWKKMYRYETVYNTVAYNTATGGDNAPDKVVNPVLPTEEGDLSRLGSGYSTYDIKSKDGRTTVSPDSDYTVFVAKASDSISGGSFLFSDQTDAYLYFKVNSVTKAGKLGVKAISWGTQFLSDWTVNITEDMVGKWIKVSASDVYHGQDWSDKTGYPNDWYGWFKNCNAPLGRWEFQALDGAEANITFGSLVALTPSVLPSNTENWSLNDWITAAAGVDLSAYINTENFKEILERLVGKNREIIAVAALKNAWASLRKTKTVYNPVMFNDATGGDYATDRIEEPINTTALSDINMLGSGYATYNITPKPGRTASDDNNDYTLFVANTASNVSSGSFRISNETNLFIYLRINSVTSEGKLGIKATSQGTQFLSDYTIDVNESMVGKWIKVSADQIFHGPSWNRQACDAFWFNHFTISNAPLTRIEFQATNGAEANITFGS
ncbi:MAG: hypothetical protein ACI4F7_02375, partial [Acutalibacteraceae bacterium]